MAYSKALVARIKGALRAGLKPKQLAKWTGIPHDTIKDWSVEDRHAAIEPDASVMEDLRLALLKEN